MDSAQQVIVAARATNQTSDKQQAVAMMEETIINTGVVPREVSADAGYYSARTVEERHTLGVEPFIAPEQTRPTAERRRRPPGDACPVVCQRGTGCGASCRPSEAASVTPCVWKRWSWSSARSSRAGASGSSCCEAWRRSGQNSLSSAPGGCTMFQQHKDPWISEILRLIEHKPIHQDRPFNGFNGTTMNERTHYFVSGSYV